MPRERLQKFIASTGLTSRRHAEELIAGGQVSINGQVVTKLGNTVDPQRDAVVVNGKPLQRVTTWRYIALHKPVGYVCSRAKHRGEKTVYELVPDAQDLVVAGRLDKDSDGLVLLTNDGELVNTITHPRYRHEKEYEIATIKPLSPEAIQQLRRGIRLDEGLAKVDRLIELRPGLYRVVIHQGWKRQLRRMISAAHNDIVRLTRVRLNALELGDLQPGSSRPVHRTDIL